MGIGHKNYSARGRPLPLLRSMMFVPGNQPRLLSSAARSNADCLILDLEDSVPLGSMKLQAREILSDFLESGVFGRRRPFVRVNDFDSGELLDDLQGVLHPSLQGFVLPKAERIDDVQAMARILDTLEARNGLERGYYSLALLIETASGLQSAGALAEASPRVVALALGSEDLVADMGGIHDDEHVALQVPRHLVVTAARAAKVRAIDTVHVRVHDIGDLEWNLRNSVILGFDGMLCLHPKELRFVHAAYSPSDEEVMHARRVQKLDEDARTKGRGVAVLDGEFVGPPMRRHAERVLRRALEIREQETAWEVSQS